jgi:hypothetical protein
MDRRDESGRVFVRRDDPTHEHIKSRVDQNDVRVHGIDETDASVLGNQNMEGAVTVLMLLFIHVVTGDPVYAGLAWFAYACDVVLQHAEER